ncbi:MAG TPA: tetratricopeptide repeat protein [Longimicrobiales bacterium]|nr:tetratricopeptide repeat protein [Longimicrobiales bacterium]
MPLAAQDPAPAASSSRFRVLVPTLERRGQVRGDFGKKVAEQVAKQIGSLATHVPVEQKEVRDALRKYKIKEEELDCIKSRQLAVQINAELVMCGTVEPGASGNQVSAQFISARTGETFEVAPFAASDPGQAAQHIYQMFDKYVKQISLAAFCRDYLASQQWAQALENCNQALAINPSSQTALNMKGMALYRSGMSPDQSEVTDSARLKEAYAIYKQVIALNPVEQDALKQAGILAARLGEAEQSRTYFRQYMELNPGDAAVRLAIAGEASRSGDAEGALRIIEEGLAADTANIDLATYAGHFAVQAAARTEDKAAQQRLFETAVKYYARVRTARGAETEAGVLQNMIQALVQLGRHGEAVAIGREAVTAKGTDSNLWLAYSTALQGANQLDQALAALDTAIARDPKNTRAQARKAAALLDAGRLQEAVGAFRAAVNAGVVDADEAAQMVFNAGYERYRSQNWDSALNFFETSGGLANSAKARGQANFWSGMIFYQRGINAAKPQNARAARAALPMFQRALSFLQGSGVEAYASETRGVNLAQTISAVRQYIDIQNQLIKRGQ